MDKIKKYCPVCGWETDNDQFNFCPQCGNDKGLEIKQALNDYRPDEKKVSELLQIMKGFSDTTCNTQEKESNGPFKEENLRKLQELEDLKMESCWYCGQLKPREDLASINEIVYCPHCGHSNADYLKFKKNREIRENLSKDELIAQLKDIAEQEVNAPRTLHRNAMCYSIDPPRAVSVKCEECGKPVVIGSYLDDHSYISRIVESIRKLGYEANVKGLCLECAKKKHIEPMLLARGPRHGQYDLGEYYHLFSFKPKDKDDFIYSITNDSLDYIVLQAFLENKTDFVYEEDIIRIKDELPIIQMMAGIALPGTEPSKLEEQLQSIYTKRNNRNNDDDPNYKKLLEDHKKKIEEIALYFQAKEDEVIRNARKNLSKDEIIAQLKDIHEHEVNDPISRINAMCYSRIPERELEKIERERQEEERYEMKRKERERKERERKERKRLKALKKKERTSNCDKEKGSSLFSKIKHFLSRK